MNIKNDSTLNGTVFYGFSKKNKDIPYSFSRELDSLNNMKLSRVEIVNNSRYIKDYNITLDKIEQSFILVEVLITNRKEIIKYFEEERKREDVKGN